MPHLTIDWEAIEARDARELAVLRRFYLGEIGEDELNRELGRGRYAPPVNRRQLPRRGIDQTTQTNSRQ